VTGEDLKNLLIVLGLIVIVASILRRTEWIRHVLRALLAASIVAVIVFVVLVDGQRMPQQDATIAVAVAGLLTLGLFPRRRRYVRRSERRKAIARFELETGKKYNPRLHELDHEVPFSRGGNSSADNLRVIDRRANRRKGSRSTWWDVFAK